MNESHHGDEAFFDPFVLSDASILSNYQHADGIRDVMEIPHPVNTFDDKLWTGILGLVLVVSLSRRYLYQSKENDINPSSSSRIFRIARESSAASLVTFKKVSSSASFARLSEAVRSFHCFTKDCFVPVISAPDLFVPIKIMKELSLEDMSIVIKYAIEHNRSNFDDSLLLANVSIFVREVIVGMDAAVIKSRGVNVRPSSTLEPQRGCNIDALYFCAAMRLFVEWRAIKITPDEYKAYAVGMNLAKRDLIQNTGKVEEAIHRWIESTAESGNPLISAPTIRQLLEFELVNHVHSRLPKLKDNTAAIGITWMTRQLRFQTETFANVIQVPHVYRTGIEAVRAAYKTVFNPYHGWAIQQVFNYAFNGAPPVSVMFEMMNRGLIHPMESSFLDGDVVIVDYPVPDVIPESLTSSIDDSTIEVGVEDEDVISCGSVNDDASRNLFQKLGDDITKNWQGFATNLEKRWVTFVEDIIHRDIGKARVRTASVDPSLTEDESSYSGRAEHHTFQPPLPKYVQDEHALQVYIANETTKVAHKQIYSYLVVMDPLLKNISATIEEFGMNDPSRV